MKNKKDNYKIIYLCLIILGTLFTIISCFHECLWFDESYSIAIAKHTFKEIWQIGSNDVHPVLYYIMIRIILIIAKNNIVCVRLFSCLPLIIMSILGYTFIRKEFGEKAGLIFSYLSLTFPTLLTYAGEIRMYTWAMLFVTLMFIYAYKIIKNVINQKSISNYKEKNSITNWIIFSIFSLASAYTHYYALVIAFIINISMLIYFIFQKKSFKKSKTQKSNYFDIYNLSLICSIISAISQIILYLPWLNIFLNQAKQVSHGFWTKFPTPINVIEFVFTGNIGEGNLQKYISIPFSIILFIFLIILLIKNWKKKDNSTFVVKIILYIWITLIVLMSIVSLIMKQSVFYQRYLFTLMGLFLIGFSILISKENKKVIALYCLLNIIVSTILNINLINMNYDKSNKEPFKYFQSELKNDDWILISDNDSSGYVTVATILNNFDKVINYDVKNWNIKEAYKCYGNTILNLDELNNIKGRMWIISNIDSNIPDEIIKKFNSDKISTKEFKTKYKNYEYKYILINLKN